MWLRATNVVMGNWKSPHFTQAIQYWRKSAARRCQTCGATLSLKSLPRGKYLKFPHKRPATQTVGPGAAMVGPPTSKCSALGGWESFAKNPISVSRGRKRRVETRGSLYSLSCWPMILDPSSFLPAILERCVEYEVC